MAELATTEGLVSLLTLTFFEIILGIDNIIFISIVCDRLPDDYRDTARKVGLFFAFVARILLLFGITWLIKLDQPLFTLNILEKLSIDPSFSGKDIILLIGGMFLIVKTTSEIHDRFKNENNASQNKQTIKGGFAKAIIQIVLIDVIFSFDSILTAVGLVKDNIIIMIIAVVIALIIMYSFLKYISSFVEKNPPIRMLALAFLVLIGFLLVVEAFGHEVPKGYVYFAMIFSFSVELLNMRLRKKTLKENLTEIED